MNDDVFLNHPTGSSDHETKDQLEGEDVANSQTELNEQRRIGDAMIDPFSSNRVPVERKPG